MRKELSISIWFISARQLISYHQVRFCHEGHCQKTVFRSNIAYNINCKTAITLYEVTNSFFMHKIKYYIHIFENENEIIIINI